jgi:hypothetical protein
MFTIYSLWVGREKLLTQNLDVKTWRADRFPVNRWRASPPENCKQLLDVEIE